MKVILNIAIITLAAVIFTQTNLSAQTIDEGEALTKKGKFKEARAIFEEIIKKDENNAEAHSDLGIVFLNRRNPEYDLEKAVDETEKAVELNPNNGDFQYNYGAALGMKTQNAGIFKQAFLAPKVKNAFKRAVDLNPKHVRARIALAQYYMMAPSIMGGDEEEAWKQLDEAIKLDEIQGRITKANFLARAKKNVEAEKEYTTLVNTYSKDWNVWKNHGYFCMRLEQYDDAVKYFKKYIELQPDNADSYQSLAEALLKKGENDQAITNLNKSLGIDKDFVPAIISLGEAYQAKGQKKEAKEAYQRAISIAQYDYLKKQAENKLKEVE